MRKICRPFFLSPVLLFLFLLLPFPALAETLKIVAGTSLIEDIVRDLTSGRVEMITLMPGSHCPGQDDVKASDFVFAAGADLALLHAFQRTMPQVAGMLEAVEGSGLRRVILESGGSWLIPEVQKQAVRDIAAALAAAAPEQAGEIGERAGRRLLRIDRAGGESLARLAAVRDQAVIASAMQAEFLRWAGLRLAGTYGRAEELTPGGIARLIDELRGRPLLGVVDNYQSGAEAGLPLALELGVPHAVLSNFPGSSEDVPDYFSLLRHNVDQLIRLGE
ncbi:MAG: metal ABC transporter substrate-binding protein [Desulfovibrio sp.]|jgi:zinc transport system substrate-binding protein|nr:metal ABC transporter substrate-binding protein [Desulfovibrio sp.]